MSGCADGAAAAAPAAVAPPPVSAADEHGPERRVAPTTSTPVAAALTIFEGQAVYKLLSPGSAAFRAGDVLRFAYGSRTTSPRLP
ncbi:hypothetical protein VH565_19775 [Sphingobium sp. 11R-BB]